MLVTCLNCATEFRAKPREKRKFCSNACYRGYEAKHGTLHTHPAPVQFSCKACGKGFSWMPGKLRSYEAKFGRTPLYCSVVCSGVGRRMKPEQWDKACVQCGKPVPPFVRPDGSLDKRKIFCSPACKSMRKRIQIQANNAGRIPVARSGRHGYMRVSITGESGAPSREVLEHRWNMEKKIGRQLRKEETVHHIDGNRANNAIENLELFSSRHGPGQRVTDQVAWAIAILTDYPEFAREAGVDLVMRQADHQAA